MGFSSIDDFVSEATANGKVWRQDFVKTSSASVAFVVGNCYDWSCSPGSPVQNLYTGATLVARTPTDIGYGGGIYHGGNVSTDTKHLINMGAYSAVATAVPSVLELVDVVMVYPTLNMLLNTSQTLINSNTFTASSSGGLLLTYTNDFGDYTSVKFTTTTTLPTGLNTTDIFWTKRVGATSCNIATSLANAIAGTYVSYTDTGTGTHTMTVTPSRYADGAGLRAYMVLTNQTGNSTNTPVMTIQYTDQSGNTGNSFGATVNFTVGGTNIPQVGKILHSGVAANNYGFFLPLAAGDSGIRSIQSYQLTTAYATATTLTAALVLCKPICTIPVVAASVAAERNLFSQLPSLPRIYDGACLNFLQFAGGATALSTAIQGYIDTAWG